MTGPTTRPLYIPKKRGGRRHGPPVIGKYVTVRMPGHHRATGRGHRVAEHVLVAERAMGKPLAATHPVHHVDLDRGNNANGNLVVCENTAYHLLLHKRQRAYDACGDANAHRCLICYTYDRQREITCTTGGRAYHRSCNASSVKRYLHARRGVA